MAANALRLTRNVGFPKLTDSSAPASDAAAARKRVTATFAVEFNVRGAFANLTPSEAAALYHTGGHYNTASGFETLYHSTSGSSNIAEGYKAGYNLTTGGNNIDIGNEGEAGDSATIRIGTQGTQTNTSIAGVYDNTSGTGPYVVIDSTGQLGVATTPPGAAVRTDYAPRVFEEMHRQAGRISELEQEVAEMRILNQAMLVALQKLQAKDQLVAQR